MINKLQRETKEKNLNLSSRARRGLAAMVAAAACSSLAMATAACESSPEPGAPSSSAEAAASTPGEGEKVCQFERPHKWEVPSANSRSRATSTLGVPFQVLKEGRAGPVYCRDGIPLEDIKKHTTIVTVQGLPPNYHVLNRCAVVAVAHTDDLQPPSPFPSNTDRVQRPHVVCPPEQYLH